MQPTPADAGSQVCRTQRVGTIKGNGPDLAVRREKTANLRRDIMSVFLSDRNGLAEYRRGARKRPNCEKGNGADRTAAEIEKKTAF